jgi:hypothetical protein
MELSCLLEILDFLINVSNQTNFFNTIEQLCLACHVLALIMASLFLSFYQYFMRFTMYYLITLFSKVLSRVEYQLRPFKVTAALLAGSEKLFLTPF